MGGSKLRSEVSQRPKVNFHETIGEQEEVRVLERIK